MAEYSAMFHPVLLEVPRRPAPGIGRDGDGFPMTMRNAIRLSPARIIALVAALAGFFAFGTVSFASADATDTIVNPFFKADTAGGGLNGWQTSGSIPASYLGEQGIGCSSAADV